jgi:L-fucose mutarotase/ribose pyranase (RbsD/FucU family)
MLLSPSLWASYPLKLAVNLMEIKKLVTTESHGDELYFAMTEYSSHARSRHYLVPRYPTHWLSRHLQAVVDVGLWEKTLAVGESAEIIFSLIERDAPPWFVDDLIGTVKLRVRNHEGHLEKRWTMPNKKITEPLAQKSNTFVMTGDEGEYHVTFKLLQAPSKEEHAE